MFDYGESLHNGSRILEGMKLYKEIWSFFPPGDTYFPAIILKFLPGFLSIRYVESFFFSLFVVVLAFITKKIINKKYAFLLSILIVFSNPQTYTWFILLPFYLSVVYIFKFLESNIRKYLFYSGICLGVGCLFRHDKYVTFLVALTVAVFISYFNKKINIKRKILNSAIVFIGSMVIVTPLIYWLIQNGTLSIFLRLAFIKGPAISSQFSTGFWGLTVFSNPLSFRGVYDAFTIFVYLFCLSIFILFSTFLFKRIKKEKKFKLITKYILTLFLVALAEIPYAYSVIDLGHLLTASMAVWVLGLYLIYEKSKEFPIYTKRIIKFFFTILFLGNFITNFWTILYYDSKLNILGDMVNINSSYTSGTTHPTKETVLKTIDFIESNSKKNDYILAVPYHSMFYYISERRDPLKYDNFLLGYVSQDDEPEIIEVLQKRDINVVIYDTANGPLGRRFQDYYPSIHNYLIENYKIIDESEEGWFFMLKKRRVEM